jgi:5-hydroxyisourate hydrolase
MSPITTHILDLSKGCPARGVSVLLERERSDGWHELGRGVTDDDGRIKTLMPPGTALETGNYRLEFDTGEYFARAGVATFFRTVVIAFVVTANEHHHVPLLLSPFGYSTYRGS